MSKLPKLVKQRLVFPNLMFSMYSIEPNRTLLYNTYYLQKSGFKYVYLHPDWTHHVLGADPMTMTTVNIAHNIYHELIQFSQWFHKNSPVQWVHGPDSWYCYSVQPVVIDLKNTK